MCADFQEVIKVAMNFQVCFWFITRGQKETTGTRLHGVTKESLEGEGIIQLPCGQSKAGGRLTE